MLLLLLSSLPFYLAYLSSSGISSLTFAGSITYSLFPTMALEEVVAKQKANVLAGFLEDPLFNLEQSSIALNVPVGTLRNWVHTGRVNVVRIGRKIYIASSEIRRIRTGGVTLK